MHIINHDTVLVVVFVVVVVVVVVCLIHTNIIMHD